MELYVNLDLRRLGMINKQPHFNSKLVEINKQTLKLCNKLFLENIVITILFLVSFIINIYNLLS